MHQYKLLKIISRRVQELRKKQGITQEELAEAADISASFLGMIERGKRILSVLTVYKLSKSLNVPIGHLFEPKVGVIIGDKKSVSYREALTKKIENILRNRKTEDKKLALKLLKKIFT